MVIDEETYRRDFKILRYKDSGQYQTSSDVVSVVKGHQELIKESPYEACLKSLFAELDRLDLYTKHLTEHLSKVFSSGVVIENQGVEADHQNSVQLLADMETITSRIERVTNILLHLNEQIVL